MDYSVYTRESFEALLRQLENGVSVFYDENSIDADYEEAALLIRNAIDALEMDVKKIDGTLFKYGYSNVNGTPDYKAGGGPINDITVRQMKNAILADENLVNQIKNIIGYDTRNWAEGYADQTLEDAAELYARIYSLQFTGETYAGSKNDGIKIPVSNVERVDNYTDWPLVTLWNLWTKENTHGENDPIYDYNGIIDIVHDGASVQGLASATLEDGVVKRHLPLP